MGSEDLVSKTDESEDHYRIVTYKSPPKELRSKILANFLNSLRYGNDYFKLIEKDNYFPAYTIYINNLLDKASISTKFAMLSDQTILGWSIYEEEKLHYVFVNKDMRGQGIGKVLIPKEIKSFTHITNKGINLWLKHYPNAEFKPFHD